MIALNLTAANEELQWLLTYLQENASKPLAEKINNGVQVEVDGKKLINKKDFDSFMDYACDMAKKVAQKGARYAGVRDTTVAEWAIHYFEEDSIIGKLYNEDGSEYKPASKITPKTPIKPVTAPTPAKRENPQMSLFSLLETGNEPPMSEVEVSKDDIEPAKDNGELNAEDEEIEVENEKEEELQGSPLYQRYRQLEAKYPNDIIFYRLGDFYEIFDANAVKIADELNLTLTGRDVGLKERIPMTGLPYHAVDVYIAKLVEKGYKIVKVDSMEERVVERSRTSEIIVDEETGEVLRETQLTALDELDEDIPTVTRIMGEMDGQAPTLGRKADDIKRASEILQSIEDLPEDEDEPYELDTSAFNSEAVAILYELFGDGIDLR